MKGNEFYKMLQEGILPTFTNSDNGVEKKLAISQTHMTLSVHCQIGNDESGNNYSILFEKIWNLDMHSIYGPFTYDVNLMVMKNKEIIFSGETQDFHADFSELESIEGQRMLSTVVSSFEKEILKNITGDKDEPKKSKSSNRL